MEFLCRFLGKKSSAHASASVIGADYRTLLKSNFPDESSVADVRNLPYLKTRIKSTILQTLE